MGLASRIAAKASSIAAKLRGQPRAGDVSPRPGVLMVQKHRTSGPRGALSLPAGVKGAVVNVPQKKKAWSAIGYLARLQRRRRQRKKPS